MYSTMKDVKDEDKVRELIAKLFKWGHYSPFEQAVISVEIKAPTVVFWQLDRHRTFRYASHLRRSGRYTEFKTDEFYVPEYFNKKIFLDLDSIGEVNVNLLDYFVGEVDDAIDLYRELIRNGVPKESARFVLPAWCMMYTEVMNVDLKNLMHFLALRMDSHAQLEIREYANAFYEIASTLFPYTIEEFSKNTTPIDYDFEGK
jgi:thymidylate synthase (FAD)